MGETALSWQGYELGQLPDSLTVCMSHSHCCLNFVSIVGSGEKMHWKQANCITKEFNNSTTIA